MNRGHGAGRQLERILVGAEGADERLSDSVGEVCGAARGVPGVR